MPSSNVNPNEPSLYPIEKGIPAPLKWRRGKRPEFPTFFTMEVNDSILILNKSPDRIRNALWYVQQRYDKEFTTEKQPTGGIRVWRIR